MNPSCTSAKASWAYLAAILGSFLIAAALVLAMRHYTQPAPLNASRAAERARALAELRAAEAEALQNPAWIDPAKGIVRLRIEDAMNLVEREWQNPAAARSNLIERVEKATAVAPPPPAKPSEFE
jgi:hypothetical protein